MLEPKTYVHNFGATGAIAVVVRPIQGCVRSYSVDVGWSAAALGVKAMRTNLRLIDHARRGRPSLEAALGERPTLEVEYDDGGAAAGVLVRWPDLTRMLTALLSRHEGQPTPADAKKLEACEKEALALYSKISELTVAAMEIDCAGQLMAHLGALRHESLAVRDGLHALRRAAAGDVVPWAMFLADI